MAEIRWTEEAQRWLRDIHAYITADNPDAAQTVVLGIYEKAQVLNQYPGIGHMYRPEAEGEIRILLYGHYRINIPSQAFGRHRHPGRVPQCPRYRPVSPLSGERPII
jgi:toxin ParE1/3/4